MLLFSHTDLQQLLFESYLTFLLLGGLLVVMLAYKDVRLPATRSFQLIVVLTFLMGLSSGLERWATLSPARIDVRVWASVAHYVLQPFVLYLELVILMPLVERTSHAHRILLALSITLNTLIYLAAPFVGDLVFMYDEHYWFCRGPLGISVYVVTFLYLGLLLLWSARLFRIERRRTAIILLFTAAIAVLTGVLEATNLVSGFIDETFALGALLYYVHLITVHESEMQAALARKDLELTQNKVRLLREQIRPHF